MSELVCIAFKDSSTADRVLNELRAMESEYVLDLEDAVIVVRDMDGKVHLKQCVDVFGGATKHGVALGILWGGLMGLLFMNPLAGLLGSIAGGAGAGAVTTAANEYGLLSDYGIPDQFIGDFLADPERGPRQATGRLLQIRGDHPKNVSEPRTGRKAAGGSHTRTQRKDSQRIISE
jgi:uncharacterized membrane protein